MLEEGSVAAAVGLVEVEAPLVEGGLRVVGNSPYFLTKSLPQCSWDNLGVYVSKAY